MALQSPHPQHIWSVLKRVSLHHAVSAIAVAALTAVAASPAAVARQASGFFQGVEWQAQSTLVGVTPTGGATGGDPLYFPTFPQYSGVVGLQMDYAGGSFVCSGTLLNDRRSILTAGHCVSDGFGTATPLRTTVFFQPAAGLPVNTRIYNNPTGVATRGVTDVFVNSRYTGAVIDQNDIAVLRMADLAPDWAISYGLYTGGLDDTRFNVAGYGQRSEVGGNQGAPGDGAVVPVTAGNNTGRLRQGDNRYDYRWGDALFGGFFTDIRPATGLNFFRTTAEIEYSWVSDFDNGRSANDAGCQIAQAFGADSSDSSYCDLGLGALEVGVAGGDSGGPNIVGGMISGVNSYGLSFGPDFGDIDGRLNSSFGEFSGYVPVNIHADFIRASMVPEPSALALALLGLAGVVVVRRKSV